MNANAASLKSALTNFASNAGIHMMPTQFIPAYRVMPLQTDTLAKPEVEIPQHGIIVYDDPSKTQPEPVNPYIQLPYAYGNSPESRVAIDALPKFINTSPFHREISAVQADATDVAESLDDAIRTSSEDRNGYILTMAEIYEDAPPEIESHIMAGLMLSCMGRKSDGTPHPLSEMELLSRIIENLSKGAGKLVSDLRFVSAAVVYEFLGDLYDFYFEQQAATDADRYVRTEDRRNQYLHHAAESWFASLGHINDPPSFDERLYRGLRAASRSIKSVDLLQILFMESARHYLENGRPLDAADDAVRRGLAILDKHKPKLDDYFSLHSTLSLAYMLWKRERIDGRADALGGIVTSAGIMAGILDDPAIV